MTDQTRAFDLACQRFVELVTDYFEGALSGDVLDAVQRHLRECPDCAEYLLQMRATVAATGLLRREAIGPRVLARLVSTFADSVGSR